MIGGSGRGASRTTSFFKREARFGPVVWLPGEVVSSGLGGGCEEVRGAKVAGYMCPAALQSVQAQTTGRLAPSLPEDALNSLYAKELIATVCSAHPGQSLTTATVMLCVRLPAHAAGSAQVMLRHLH